MIAGKLDRVTFYSRTLAVPARRDVGTRATDAGECHFRQLGCESCHLPELLPATATWPGWKTS